MDELRDTQYNLPIGTDCISRRKLLDKFEPWLEVHDYNDGERNVIKAVLYEIKCMPPATDNNVATRDCISRQAALNALHTWFRDGFDEDKWWNSTHVLAAIEGLPSAEPRTGKWKNIVDGIEYSWGTCDTCGARIPMVYEYYEYCPHCGAKMEVTE